MFYVESNFILEIALQQEQFLAADAIITLAEQGKMKLAFPSFVNALSYQQKLGLSPRDSIIYAAMVADLRIRSKNEEKCFLSRDRKAFDSEDDDRPIKAELALYNCRYIGSFQQGLDYIWHTLQSAG